MKRGDNVDMNIVFSPNGIVDGNRFKQGIRDIVNVGVFSILLELKWYYPEWELENLGKPSTISSIKTKKDKQPSELYSQAKAFLVGCKEENINIPIIHAPYLSRNTKRDDLYNVLLDLSKESIKICDEISCRYIIIRPIFAGVSLEEEWKVNREYYISLAKLAKEHNVMILLENQCKYVNGHLVRGICADPYEAVEWIDKLNQEVGEERFGFCMDVGVCSLCGQDMREFATVVGSRIKAVICRDCNVPIENAMLPFTAVGQGQTKMNWLDLIRGLREIDFDGHFILDFSDTAKVFSPILKPQLLQLAKAIADYFKWQIELESLLKKYKKIVLFGAGNMCRNYMKCYGEKYPPLFTCDNNKNLWGSEFCGLEVKKPEVLKDLPNDCAIFICNIYYREIEKQLKSIGVNNPIEFFNDEYMPSFYFDRLEREE